jgi:septum formation protein
LAEEENLKILELGSGNSTNKSSPWKLILASGSPRREKILKSLKLDFEIIVPCGTVEKYFRNPIRTVNYNSSIKAHFVYNHAIINSLNYSGAVIAGFDTIVYRAGKYFGKPADRAQALDFLEMLSGRTHKVITGITLINAKTGSILTGSEATTVRFKKLDRKLIEHYVAIEDVLDKAGAYDISGTGIIFIENINGCFYNVAGLPVIKFINMLAGFGLGIF